MGFLQTLLGKKQLEIPSQDLPLADEQRIFKAIEEHVPVIMILGRAGTGKTTLIRTLIEKYGANQVVVAPTGVAAVNVGGQTIHSFFRIPPRMHNLSEILPKRGAYKLFKNLQRIIIDEISMVRADVLDAIDYALKINRKDERPFGGVQMVLVGDFLQLPPVVRSDEEEILNNLGYETPYAFSAKCMKDNMVKVFELSKVHRQDNPEYIRLLGNLRSGQDVPATIQSFNDACHGVHKRTTEPVILTGTNAIADRYNIEGLKKLPGQAVSYEGTIVGEFNLDKDKLPAPELLTLKVGARIMMVKNDVVKKWVNGSLGTVVRLGQDRVWVNLDDNKSEYEVVQTAWEHIRYEWDEATGRIKAKVVGSYSQIPVIPAWALTIHKAQGLTLANVRIDLTSGAFAAGQAYVALSRARDLEGLSFASPLRVSDIIIDQRIVGQSLLR